MAKIMLVEDDTSLLEIYKARLEAEGFEIVTAHDGEEALTVALKEHPDLIIADVMMPKVSGFDMVDILRSTPETKGTKIIMMTALNQAEDKARAEKLGADKYLVKSQVTLEDVTREVNEILAEQESEVDKTVTSATGEKPENNTPPPATPTAKPVTKVTPVAVAPEPSQKKQSTPVGPNQTSPPKQDEQKPATEAQKQASSVGSNKESSAPTQRASQQNEEKAPVNVKPIEVASEPPAPLEPVAPKTSMPPNEEEQPPNLPKSETNEKLETENDPAQKPKVTPIAVSDDSSGSEDESSEENEPESSTKDPFLAQNPTLSDSPYPDDDSPAPASEVTEKKENKNASPEENAGDKKAEEDKKTEIPNKVAEDAVDSLLKTPSKGDNKSEEESSGPKYVSAEKESGSDSNEKSLSHSKTIQPTPGIENQTKPHLPDISTISNEDSGEAPPPVNAVIAPDPNTGPASSSNN